MQYRRPNTRFSGRYRIEPPKVLRGGISKVNFQETLSICGDKCPQNGSKTAPTAPRPHLGYPHIGPFVGYRGAVGVDGRRRDRDRVEAEELLLWGLLFRVQGAGCRVQGAGCRVAGLQGAGCRV